MLILKGESKEETQQTISDSTRIDRLQLTPSQVRPENYFREDL